jgi:hypothetical protein
MSKYVPTGRPRGRPRKSPPAVESTVQPLPTMPGPDLTDTDGAVLSDGTVVETPEEYAWGVKEKPKAVAPTPPPAPPVPAPRMVFTPPPIVPKVVLPKKAQTIGGVFDGVRKLKTPAEQVAWLRLHDKVVLRYLIRLGYENVTWLLPKGLPPYTPFVMRRGGRIVPIKPGQTPTELHHEARRLYLFLDGSHMDRARREKLFQSMIEGMAAEEVEVLLALKDKKLDKYVAKDVVSTAFPGVFTQPFHVKFIR